MKTTLVLCAALLLGACNDGVMYIDRKPLACRLTDFEGGIGLTQVSKDGHLVCTITVDERP